MASQVIPTTPTAKRSRKLSGNLIGYVLVAPPLLLMALLIFLPALQSVGRTLFIDNDNGTSTFTIARYVDFFKDPISISNLFFTFRITLLVVGFLFLLCFPLAVYLRFSKAASPDGCRCWRCSRCLCRALSWPTR